MSFLLIISLIYDIYVILSAMKLEDWNFCNNQRHPYRPNLKITTRFSWLNKYYISCACIRIAICCFNSSALIIYSYFVYFNSLIHPVYVCMYHWVFFVIIAYYVFVRLQVYNFVYKIQIQVHLLILFLIFFICNNGTNVNLKFNIPAKI